MPGFGAERGFARGQSSNKRIKKMTINFPKQGGNGETVVEHEHEPPHPAQRFRFAADEGEAFAAHIAKHAGLKLPGKAAGSGESAESEVSKADFD